MKWVIVILCGTLSVCSIFGKRTTVFLHRQPKKGVTLEYRFSTLSHVFSPPFSLLLPPKAHISNPNVRLSAGAELKTDNIWGQMLTDVNTINSYADRRLRHWFPISWLLFELLRKASTTSTSTKKDIGALFIQKSIWIHFSIKFLKCSVMAFCKQDWEHIFYTDSLIFSGASGRPMASEA